MARKLKAREEVPVLTADGRVSLGSCEVRKFTRTAGAPLKEVVVRDLEGRALAFLFVFRLHTRVLCGGLEETVGPVDSKEAARVARSALEAACGGPAAVLRAVAAAKQSGTPARVTETAPQRKRRPRRR